MVQCPGASDDKTPVHLKDRRRRHFPSTFSVLGAVLSAYEKGGNVLGASSASRGRRRAGQQVRVAEMGSQGTGMKEAMWFPQL